MVPGLLLALVLAASASTDSGGADAGVPASNFPGAEKSPALTAEIDRALSLRRDRRQVEALGILDAVRRQALSEKKPEVATNALNRRGDLLHDLQRNEEARAAYTEAYGEAQQRGDFWAMGRAAHDLALLGRYADLDPVSVEWFGKAMEARRKARDFAGLRVTANNLATAYNHAGRPDEALPFYEEGIQAAESAGDDSGALKMHVHLSSLLLAKGDRTGDESAIAQGRAHLGKAVTLSERLGLTTGWLCAHLPRDEQDRCEKYWPQDFPAARAALASREADKAERVLQEAVNGFPAPAQLLLAARHNARAAKELRDAGAPAERIAALERKARGQLLDGLANRDATSSLGTLCAAEDVRELCRSCGLAVKP